MYALINPRRLAMIAAVMAGTFVGSWATASPSPPTTDATSIARPCSAAFCPNLVWLRAPILRARAL